MVYKNILECSKKTLFAAIIFIAIAIFAFFYGVKVQNEDINSKNKTLYHDLISESRDNENMYVKVVIDDLPYHVAIEEKDNITYEYYFVCEDNYMYLARLTDKTYDKLKDMYDNDKENFSYILEGYIYYTPSELKEIAIDVYNEASGKEILNNENFSSYLGSTYLDETITPQNDTAILLYIGGFVSLIIGLICLIIYIVSFVRHKKVMQKYDRNMLETELMNAVNYPKNSLFLTDNYIISTLNGLMVIEYSELVWAYNEKRYYNGIHIGTYLRAYNNKNKFLQLAYTKKNEDILQEIMLKIKEKNNNILIGFTDENKKLYKEIKKNLKKK